MAIRIGDYRVSGGRVTLVKTGNGAPLDRRLVAEALNWALFFAALRLTAPRASGPAIWFTPQRPAGRYQLVQAAIAAGVPIAATPARAAAAFIFDDATRSPAAECHGLPSFNAECRDISKSRVAAVFASVFGYPLALDPQRHVGPAVEKGETNGAHDGRIVACPTAPIDGRVYQRVIDNIHDGEAEDLRTQVVGGRVVAVWIKRRPAAARFLPPNSSVRAACPVATFSAAEHARIAAFAAAMGADWCALDILRDRDGRIYIVDVNKTDAGPITALSLRQKLQSARLLGGALRGLLAGLSPTRQPA